MKIAKKISMKTHDKLVGLFYISPFLIGLCTFFLFPVITSLLLSFGDIDNSQYGFHIVLEGMKNYRDAFLTDTEFLPRMYAVIRSTLINSPLIVIFSLILAVMLSKVEKGKGIFRVAFLLPFILGTGEVMVSPILLLNMIFTVICSFTESTNSILVYITQVTTKYAKHGFAAAMGWIYFVFILALIGIVILFLGGYIKRNQGYALGKSKK